MVVSHWKANRKTISEIVFQGGRSWHAWKIHSEFPASFTDVCPTVLWLQPWSLAWWIHAQESGEVPKFRDANFLRRVEVERTPEIRQWCLSFTDDKHTSKVSGSSTHPQDYLQNYLKNSCSRLLARTTAGCDVPGRVNMVVEFQCEWTWAKHDWLANNVTAAIMEVCRKGKEGTLQVTFELTCETRTRPRSQKLML